jgi:hypothetical protein
VFESEGRPASGGQFGVIVGVITTDEPMWRTSRRCESGACVEVGKLGEIIMVRRSADPDGRCLKLSCGKWREFVTGLKRGQFDGL